MIGEDRLHAEFDQAREELTRIGRHRLRQARISVEAELRAGGLGVLRIATAGRLWHPDPLGRPALIVPAWRGVPPSLYTGETGAPLVDLLAFRTCAPDTWFYRVAAPFVTLGEDLLQLAHHHERPVSVHRTPLDWLRADCRGVCLAEWCENALEPSLEALEAAA